ncbi:hypothetical protein F5X96DRAFT_405702 [Biscogniauxia mediterranea]|nr:hypothetical protein F5X96DRAFT_405702 [Biscogniauxia mediterranea]
MVDGFTRTLRQEHPSTHLVTLALDGTDGEANKTSLILQVLHEMMSWVPPQRYEEEYVEQGGFLHTRRLVEANYLKSIMNERLTPYNISSLPIRAQAPFNLAITPAGTENTPHYISSAPFPETLEGDIVELAVKAVSLRPQGQLGAQGREEYQSLGSACTGIILRTAPDAAFSPGDHVFVACGGSLSSHLRISARKIVIIPNDLSFADACRVMPARAAAYHALVEVGRVQPGESVLVHDGASPVGHAILQLATIMEVTDLWTTVADEEESVWITENTRVAQERVLPKAWFDKRPLISSPWKRRRFDLVISASAEPVNSLLAKSVKRGGHYVVLHSPSLPSGYTRTNANDEPSNISISILEGSDGRQESRIPSRASLQYACAVSRSSLPMRARDSFTEFRASELDNAIR